MLYIGKKSTSLGAGPIKLLRKGRTKFSCLKGLQLIKENLTSQQGKGQNKRHGAVFDEEQFVRE